MKRSKTVSILLFLVLSLVIGAQGAFGAPKVSVKSPEYQAGEVPQGAVIVHSFALKNVGDLPLTLKVKTCTCGGVKFETPAKSIVPGGSDEIKVSIPTRYSNGEFVKEILVQTNEPDGKDLKLTIRATVKEVLSVLPRIIVFRPENQGSGHAKEITVTNMDKKPVTILGAETEPAGAFEVSFQGNLPLKPGQKKAFRMVYSPDKAAGKVQGSLTLRTNMKQLPELKVPIIMVSAGKNISRPK
jgi:hypothetical protein